MQTNDTYTKRERNKIKLPKNGKSYRGFFEIDLQIFFVPPSLH
jgi:hypothetical protein